MAVDFSDPSRSSLASAITLAQAFGAKLCLVYVVEPPPFMSGAHTDPIMISDEEIALLARNKLQDLAEAEIPSGIAVTTEIVTGRSHREIVAWAKKWRADLIVIATHGRTGLKHVFLGSTAEAVVRHAPCPVLITRKRK